MFVLVAEKEFKSGSLKGVSVPYRVTYPSREIALNAHLVLSGVGTKKDIFGCLVTYKNIRIEALRDQ